ncbi:MAG: aldehyde ferredoxin oxidoreductase family protein [Deltaproteobacteria bacterium]|nr:aldehyde ferredoxin oxidoreductase family protein [Candidatus Anaeroferrophillus wilburensis]MBN2888959.1 aldehyde ferredoxin oxidoreductase family protein [Deltaproteobacteria bacterium]
MDGFYGRLLIVDLSRQSFKITPLANDVYASWLGGKGLASYLLYHHNPPGIDPLAPENCLIFATGPFTGSRIWGSCRYGVYSKSLQTGIYAESYAGGKVPEAIDAAGFDALLIKGAGNAPLVLRIHPDGADFLPGDELWGLDTYSSEDALHERFTLPGYPKAGAVVIGPAGENLVRFAVIENDYWRSAGRTGLGAVMGAKKLKGILFQGDRQRPVADAGGLTAWAKDFARQQKDNPAVQTYKTKGTPMMVRIMNQAGAFPTRYWSRGSYDRWPQISADALHERCQVTPHACLKCFMACGRLTTLLQGRHAGLQLEGPEYETIYAFGGLCEIDSIEEIAHLNDLCDRLGMDTITAGNLCAFAIEAARRGRLDYPIDYGQVDAITELLAMIAERRGIGAILAEGIRSAAKAWDLEDLAVHVKGLEPAGYDPRVLQGMGLGYAASDRGACHLRSTFYKAELSGMIDPDQPAGTAELFIDFENRLTIFDSLILCRFYRDLYPWELLELLLQGVTGKSYASDELKTIAARIADLVRRFNLREGMDPATDRLPRQLHRQLEDSGKVITEAHLADMLAAYYRLHGWDDKGRPHEQPERHSP